MADQDSGVGWLIVGMFAYGFVKSSVYASLFHRGCPVCAQQEAIKPAHVLKSWVSGPVLEEITFRKNLPAVMGDDPAAVAFGVAHAHPRYGTLGNVARVVEAGLAGALVYAKAFDRGGVFAAATVHAAHNAGTDLGIYHAMKRKAQSPQARWQA